MTAALLALALAAGPAPVRVGSKEFTESEILGALATQVLVTGGVPAEHRRALGGTRILWEALRRGDVDVYPDYTGTLAEEILGGAVAPDERALRAALRPLGVGITGSLGFEDTYALAMRRTDAERLGIRRISELVRHRGLRFGFTNEFMDRKDGWPALRARYRLPQRRVRGMAHDLAYAALAAGELDVIDVYSTDAELRRHHLTLLEDDRRAFPPYRAVYVYRLDLDPTALAALRRLEGRIGAPAMIDLNARVLLDRASPEAVAGGFLRAALGLAPEVRVEGRRERILARTREHLALVGTALAGAIAVGVPLGVLAARRRRLGRVVLGVVGLVQTIPSLALLVFMIPLVGIGAGPSIAALFLYGLLPIVRNTHAGLTGIPPELADSARAIGLPPGARLRLVELPLAAPAILAGVKTSAVIAVGTATLGALAGAGGYGQPILAGIRLASIPLILEGAIPAAALALAVEAAFDALEPVLVPRGLRRGPPAPPGGSRART
ncbi:ABC transporter permease/substrate-binding protein [Anaeromyxobacter oryzisoli]|uniref:ABC transporter permease/substrate-binding protein n=1 Tax=Anaeromyxobacter oryzisoli TaxID=2925408 RepID=UPI001F58BC77|nr:glycine betaine ABC transporter substrate-binding protein [Anaeromyxobacter sp. SG63]